MMASRKKRTKRTAFTPGPWSPGHLGEKGRCQCRSIVDHGYAGGIATVCMNNGIKLISEGGNDAPPRKEAIANMHLIAAAPDLYAAVEALLTQMEWLQVPVKHPQQTLEREAARAALDKARGVPLDDVQNAVRVAREATERD